MGCQARVSDHTDFVDCGETVLRGGKCAFHLQEESRTLLRTIRDHEAQISACRNRLNQLNSASG